MARRMVGEVIYGTQARGDVKLSEIGRTWGKADGALTNMIERLGRQLERPGVRRGVQENLLKLGARRESAEVVPLYQDLYSQEAPGFLSENKEILKAIDQVSRAVEDRGIWVIDRGGDRGELLGPLLKWELDFVIRMEGGRHVRWGRQKLSVAELAGQVRRKWSETVVKEEGAREKAYHLRFGATKVRLPGHEDRPLTLVVVDGFGREPLMLLTTRPAGRARKRVWRIVESYVARYIPSASCFRISDSFIALPP